MLSAPYRTDFLSKVFCSAQSIKAYKKRYERKAAQVKTQKKAAERYSTFLPLFS
jgi:hypothetical protein